MCVSEPLAESTGPRGNEFDLRDMVTPIDTLNDGITPRAELVPVRFNGLQDSFHVRVPRTLSSDMCLRPTVNAGMATATRLLAEGYAPPSSAIPSEPMVDWGYENRAGDEVAVLFESHRSASALAL